jgi:hypothetical protein
LPAFKDKGIVWQDKTLQKVTKKFLLHDSFYTMEEFLDWIFINDLNTLHYNS